MIKKTNLELLLISGLNYVHQYLLHYCDTLIKEQRRIDLQIKLRRICNTFRGTQKITKYVLIDFQTNLENLHYIKTETYKHCLKDLKQIILLYNKYYEDYGIRKN